MQNTTSLSSDKASESGSSCGGELLIETIAREQGGCVEILRKETNETNVQFCRLQKVVPHVPGNVTSCNKNAWTVACVNAPNTPELCAEYKISHMFSEEYRKFSTLNYNEWPSLPTVVEIANFARNEDREQQKYVVESPDSPPENVQTEDGDGATAPQEHFTYYRATKMQKVHEVAAAFAKKKET